MSKGIGGACVGGLFLATLLPYPSRLVIWVCERTQLNAITRWGRNGSWLNTLVNRGRYEKGLVCINLHVSADKVEPGYLEKRETMMGDGHGTFAHERWTLDKWICCYSFHRRFCRVLQRRGSRVEGKRRHSLCACSDIGSISMVVYSQQFWILAIDIILLVDV